MKSKQTYQQLERELKKLKEIKDIIERSPAVAFLWKNQENWPVEFVSNNVNNIFGYSANDFITGKIVYSELIHSDDLPRVAEEVKTNSESNSISFTHEPYRIICKSGEVKWLKDLTYIRRDENGKITHYDGIILDITEQKKTEQALIESEEKLRELNATKDKFFSIIAHDLKSPFNSILGFTELLHENYQNFNSEKRENLIKLVNDSAKKAFNLTENLLTWSLSQSGKISFNPENLNLKTAVFQIITIFHEITKKKEIQLINNIIEDEIIYADKNMLILYFEILFLMQ